MGNYGTTPSWDDEQIAKHGFWEHLTMCASRDRARTLADRKKIVDKWINDVLALLPSQTEEDRARATAAIPDVLIALALGRMAMQNWRGSIAGRVYDDWRKRTNQDSNVTFSQLAGEDQKPFLDVVEAVVKARNAEVLGPVVHAMMSGKPMCGFTNTTPIHWLPRHSWVAFHEVARVTCPTCKERAEKHLRIDTVATSPAV